MLACAALGACEIPKEVNPVVIYREVTGIADRGRAPPPGLEQPFPNLAVVPARPERPALTAREAVSAGLAADRERSRGPLAPAGPGEPAAAPAAPGDPPIPGQPPPRPSLAAAPVVPWTEPDAGVARPGAGGASRAGAPGPVGGRVPAAPTVPDAAPAPPPPDLLGAPPAPPAPDLLAPPAAPRLR